MTLHIWKKCEMVAGTNLSVCLLTIVFSTSREHLGSD